MIYKTYMPREDVHARSLIIRNTPAVSRSILLRHPEGRATRLTEIITLPLANKIGVIDRFLMAQNDMDRALTDAAEMSIVDDQDSTHHEFYRL